MSSTAAAPAPAAAPDLPPMALRLGYAGLVPFVVGALLVWIVREDAHPYATLALSAYAAVIVSFLGGIHWGIGFRDGDARSFLWGVVPSLVAWVAVMMPASAGLVIHGAMLWACYAVDRRSYPRHGLARWLTLRFRLSAVAGFACFIGAAGT
jgi:hypothetical protein